MLRRPSNMHLALGTVILTALTLGACGSDDTAVPSEPGTPGFEQDQDTVPSEPEVPTTIDLDAPQPGDDTIDDDLPETEEELTEIREAGARTNLRLEATAAPASVGPGGEFAVAVVVTSIDDAFVNAPIVSVVLPDGVAPVQSIADECTVSADATLMCQVAPAIISATGETPVSTDPFAIPLEIADSASAGSITLTFVAESLDNSVDNDPDPTDNTTTIEINVDPAS